MKKSLRWLWHGQRADFLGLLKQFARGENQDKRRWSRQLSHEVFLLLKNPTGFIEPHDSISASVWQNAGADFLRKFYALYLGRGDGYFPEYFFSESGASRFGRKDFLKAFNTTNKINLCPACDIQRFHRIDHYFAKEHYPHFSCHPYNLVPTCDDCNTDYKGTTNVLLRGSVNRITNQGRRFGSGKPRLLQNIALPYRENHGFDKIAYLKFNVKRGFRNPVLVGFKPQSGEDLLESAEVHRDVFWIPNRWRDNIDEIKDSVYRQIKKVFQQQVDFSPNQRGDLDIFAVRDLLDSVLCSLYDEQKTEAERFPMTWCLIEWLNHELEPAVNSPSAIDINDYPLLKDIASILKQDTIPHPAYVTNPRLETARNLRKIAQGK